MVATLPKEVALQLSLDRDPHGNVQVSLIETEKLLGEMVQAELKKRGSKAIVARDIVRVVTPGTVIDTACLEEGRSNFCAGLYLDDTCAGFSVCDISTGKTHVTAFQGPDRAEHLLNELGRFPRRRRW